MCHTTILEWDVRWGHASANKSISVLVMHPMALSHDRCGRVNGMWCTADPRPPSLGECSKPTPCMSLLGMGPHALCRQLNKHTEFDNPTNIVTQQTDTPNGATDNFGQINKSLLQPRMVLRAHGA